MVVACSARDDRIKLAYLIKVQALRDLERRSPEELRLFRDQLVQYSSIRSMPVVREYESLSVLAKSKLVALLTYLVALLAHAARSISTIRTTGV